jgi:dihydroorotate dehydrogenase (fumarate)
MVDLSTEYLGLKLDNPLVPSASPLSEELDSASALEDAGASALVMHSMFEEKIAHETEHLARFFHQQSIGHGEAESFHPVPDTYLSYHDKYLEQLQKLKAHLSIPVIASLNGMTPGGWIDYGKTMQEAGADALELNVYYLAANPDEDSAQIENRYIEILQSLREHISIPITVKLSSQFSALIPFTKRLQQHGANGIVIFNRFYQPDINLETLHVEPKVQLSTSQESLLRIHWTAILSDHLDCSLAVTGGMHNHEDVLKALLAGADITHMCSALLQHGPAHIATTLQQLQHWLKENEYESVQQLKGSISRQHAIDPAAYERENYISVLDSYTPADGVLR